MTKYERIANDMKEKIENGIYKPNDQLPFEAEMCDAYGVSSITVKKGRQWIFLSMKDWL